MSKIGNVRYRLRRRFSVKFWQGECRRLEAIWRHELSETRKKDDKIKELRSDNYILRDKIIDIDNVLRRRRPR